MVGRAEGFRVAGELRALKKDKVVRVSMRRVQEKLVRKGSLNDVGSELLRWKFACKLINRLDQTVLSKAFQGKHAPHDSDDERAAGLLERIKAGITESPQPHRGRGRPRALPA